MRKLIHFLHSIILFLKNFFGFSKQGEKEGGVGMHREGGNNISQSKKHEDMEEAKAK